MLPSIRDKEKKRLEIARTLAACYFDESKNSSSSLQIKSNESPLNAILPSLKVSSQPSTLSGVPSKTGITNLDETSTRDVASMKQKRLKSTLTMMKKSEYIYNMEREKSLITEYNLTKMEKELEKISLKDFNRINIIIELVSTHLKAALFGCDVDIGICTDSSLKEIEYFGDINYVRKLPRKDGITAFTCIDRKEIVVEVVSILNDSFTFIFMLSHTVGNWEIKV